MSLHLITGNSYRALRSRLIDQIQTEFHRIVSRGDDPVFSPIPIVTTPAIGDDICHAVARSDAKVAIGLRFDKLNRWLKGYGSLFLKGTGLDRELDWLIWSILKEKKEGNSFKPFEVRLENYVKDKNDFELFSVASRISSTFVQYLNYRANWVFEWLGLPLEQSVPDKELDEAKKHPDYLWQVELFKEIKSRLSVEKPNQSAFLKTIEDFVVSLNKEDSEKANPNAIPDFFFMPEVIPPLALPFIEKVAREKDVYVYLMRNTQVDFTDLLGSNSYLERNAKENAKLIERFEAFDPKDALQHDFAKEKTLTADTLPFERHACDSVLTRLQEAVWENRTPDFTGIDFSTDTSLRIGKAPSLAREIETVIDWIFAIKEKEGKNLTSEEILVLMPDVAKAAPLIEGIMATLPSRYVKKIEGEFEEPTSIAYNILGDATVDASQLPRAFFAIAKFLDSAADFEGFTQLLRFKALEKAWHLTADTSSIALKWLSCAGFLSGLDDEHLEVLAKANPARALYFHSDGTLERALERLMLSDAINDNGLASFFKVKPINGTEVGGYNRVNENLEILTALCHLYKAFKSVSQGICERKTGPEWLAWTHEAIECLFPGLEADSEFADEIATLMDAANHIANAQTRVFLEGQTLDYPAWIKALELETGKSSGRNKPYGSVTFASLTLMRYLPKKAVALIGMDEDSAFPGKNKEEEFSLMSVGTPWPGDIDTRAANRNRFLDAILTAEKYVFISYNAGTDPKGKNQLNPSSVVQDLLQWLSFAGLKKETIEFPIPLMSYSDDMFTEKRGARFWNGHDAIASVSHKNAVQSHYGAQEALFVDTLDESLNPVDKELPPIEIPEKLHLNDLMKCWNEPDSFVEGLLRLGSPELQADEADPCTITTYENRLFESAAKRKIFAELERLSVAPGSIDLEGENLIEAAGLETIKDYIETTPQFGAEGVRGKTSKALLKEVASLYVAKYESGAAFKKEKALTIPLKTKDGKQVDLLVPEIEVSSAAPNESILVNFSNREAARNTALYIAHCAAGANLSLTSLSWDKGAVQTGKHAAIEKENAQSLIHALFTHYEKTVEKFLVTTTPEHFSPVAKPPKFSTLFRGREKLKDDFSEEKKKADTLFGEWLGLYDKAAIEKEVLSREASKKKAADALVKVKATEEKIDASYKKIEALKEDRKTAKKPESVDKKIATEEEKIRKNSEKLATLKDKADKADEAYRQASDKPSNFSEEMRQAKTLELRDAIEKLGETIRE